MIEEIQKRPFIRPLLFWITGVLLYTFLPNLNVTVTAFSLILSSAFLLLFFRHKSASFDKRWCWGVFIAFFIIALSILMSAYKEKAIADEHEYQEKITLIRQGFMDNIDRLDLSSSGKKVLNMMLVGGNESLDRKTRTQFSVTGVTHILSVSGFHVAVVCGFLSLLLKPLPSTIIFKWTKYVLMISLLWGFTFISGLAPPSVRAAIMLSFFLTGNILGRMTDGYNTLAASAFCMLVYNPFYIFDIGFQLSYIAVLFILLLQPLFSGMLEIKNPLLATPYNWITISIAAQIGTAFLCLYYFSQFPVLFLFANLPFSLVCTILIPLGLVYILLPPDFILSDILGLCTQKMIVFLLYIVESFSSYSWATFIFPFDFFDLLLGYSFLAMIILFCYKKNPRNLFLSLSFASAILIKTLIEKVFS